MFLEFSQNSQGNTCVRVSFLKKLLAWPEPATLLTRGYCTLESLAQLFSCEFCEIFKYTLFHRTVPLASSENEQFWEISLSQIFMITVKSKTSKTHKFTGRHKSYKTSTTKNNPKSFFIKTIFENYSLI